MLFLAVFAIDVLFDQECIVRRLKNQESTSQKRIREVFRKGAKGRQGRGEADLRGFASRSIRKSSCTMQVILTLGS